MESGRVAKRLGFANTRALLRDASSSEIISYILAEFVHGLDTGKKKTLGLLYFVLGPHFYA